MQQNGLFRAGSVIVGDNVLIPGAPDFRKYMATSPDFYTVEHITNIEYNHCVPDIVTVSVVKGTETTTKQAKSSNTKTCFP